MIDVSKAANLIAEHQLAPCPESAPLLESLGRILAEPVIADRGGAALFLKVWKSWLIRY